MNDQEILAYLNALSEGEIAVDDDFIRADFIDYIRRDKNPVRSVQELTNQGQLGSKDPVHKYWAHLLNYGTHHLSALACVLDKVDHSECEFPVVIDIGCGIGTASLGLRLLDVNVGDRLIGLDHNAEALGTFERLTEQRFSDVSTTTNIDALPLLNDDVLVVCSYVFGQTTVDERLAAEIAVRQPELRFRRLRRRS